MDTLFAILAYVPALAAALADDYTLALSLWAAAAISLHSEQIWD